MIPLQKKERVYNDPISITTEKSGLKRLYTWLTEDDPKLDSEMIVFVLLCAIIGFIMGSIIRGAMM